MVEIFKIVIAKSLHFIDYLVISFLVSVSICLQTCVLLVRMLFSIVSLFNEFSLEYFVMASPVLHVLMINLQKHDA